ncbi:Kinesin-5 [Acorus calamus]|uniref:Kinesin-5 n=1 Tax=Acorus calamus TaxID=4465 RepID=A0AAV9DUU6_ACOCL|nr:Kinesin-5 [Acorus calamus]
MGSRNQNKPPANPPRSPSRKKENLDEPPLDKRRKIGGKMVGPANAAGRAQRQVFSDVNADPNQTAGSGASDCGGDRVEFTREDVVALLNEKMKAKDKLNYKERTEFTNQYIKKLKTCIKWFQEVEEGYRVEQEQLKSAIESAERVHSESETQWKAKEEQLSNVIAEHREMISALEEKLKKEEADKLAALDSYKKETDARHTSEMAHKSVLEELEKARAEVSNFNQQVTSLQDTNKRLQEYNTSLQQYNSKLQGDAAAAAETIERVQKEKTAMMENLSGLRIHNTLLQEQLTSSRSSQEEAIKQKEVLSGELGCLRAELHQVRDERDLQTTQIQAMSSEIARFTEFTGKSTVELENLTTKTNVLEETCSSQREQIRLLQHQLASANEKLKMADLTTLDTRTEFEAQKKLVEDLQNRLADAELQIVEAEKLRKKLHNTILELKGNIRVFCRVRPVLSDDDCNGMEAAIAYPTSLEYQGRGIDLLQGGKYWQKYAFSFDKVFDHGASQQDVFVEISQLVQSALDGYKVCIFAYGQTGSGKTYTMMGRPEAATQKGLIPRSLEQASVLEIYNETIRDLLCVNRAGGYDFNGGPAKQYSIKHDANGNTFVSDLTIIDVCSSKEVSMLLRQAAQSRSVGKTQMNEQSSRSHFVFTLRISGVNEAINKSLSSLSDVIFALAKKEEHVPFRNSKLTYLLQPCLGGDSKTLMFVNISPEKKENLDEPPLDKRRKIGGKMVGPANSAGRPHRQVFSDVNADPNQTAGSGASDCGGDRVEFTREDIVALLNEKLKQKDKLNYKERTEFTNQYIKKLKSCIKWFQEVEEGYQVEQEQLKSAIESAERVHSESETQWKAKEEQLSNVIAEHREMGFALEEKLKEEEAEKLAAMDSYKKETDARHASEMAHKTVLEELEKARAEISNFNQQIISLQDINKRLQEYNTSLQQYNSKLQGDAGAAAETIERVQKEKTAMMENLSSLRIHNTLLQEQLTSCRSSQEEAIKQKEVLSGELVCLRVELHQVRDERDLQTAQIQALNSEISRFTEFTGKSTVELENLTTKTNVLEDTCSSQREQIRLLQHQLASANEKLKMADLTTLDTRTEFEAQRKLAEGLQNRLADAELQIVEAEKLRKKLHNTILVFDHGASQEDVFVEISQLVQSAMDGYKVCIFAYGQTGSGKTYTMMGKPEAAAQKGLIPRSLEKIFQASQALESQGWKYKMQASVLEIYNETIRDLLCVNRAGGHDVNGGPAKQYSIKHDANGNTFVSDLTIIDVCSTKEVSMLLRQAAQSRSVGKTQMNEQSSRSHFVFTLRISGVNESTEQQVQGVLNLIDLAGSERLSKSQSTGDRLKETQAINKSLSSLSDVIFALAKKEEHVPFRNSKLTYLLQPCLGGDSKTLMFVNISPEVSSVGESLCSLRFAARVNACEIGVPRRQATLRSSDSRLSYG